MIGEEIPNAINIFLGIYTLIILVLAFFINRYFIRKNSSIFINILCVFFVVHNIINDYCISFGFIF